MKRRKIICLLTLLTFSSGVTWAQIDNGGKIAPIISFLLSKDYGPLIFTSRRSGDAQLYSMELDGSNVHQITSTGSTFGASNSDATLVAYESIRNTQQDIFVANYDGTGEVQLTNDTFRDFRPVFFAQE